MENDADAAAAIIPGLSCVLDRLCSRNDQFPPPKIVSNFHALDPPSISISDYLVRLGKYAACSGKCFVLALIYIDRIIQGNPNFIVNSLNIHRLLISSVMLAAKFFDDQYFNNAYYAKVGGVTCPEINSLEVDFLFMTNFALFVTEDIYDHYHNELINHSQNTRCGCGDNELPDFVIPGLSPIGQHGFTKGNGSRSPGPLPIATHKRLLKPMIGKDDDSGSDEATAIPEGTTITFAQANMNAETEINESRKSADDLFQQVIIEQNVSRRRSRNSKKERRSSSNCDHPFSIYSAATEENSEVEPSSDEPAEQKYYDK